jgi:hypothetical protein
MSVASNSAYRKKRIKTEIANGAKQPRIHRR